MIETNATTPAATSDDVDDDMSVVATKTDVADTDVDARDAEVFSRRENLQAQPEIDPPAQEDVSVTAAMKHCQKLGQAWAKQGTQEKKSLYAFLASVDVTAQAAIKDYKAFKKLCTDKKLKVTAATQNNPYVAIIQIATMDQSHRPPIDRKMASKYGQAIQYARSEKVCGAAIAQFLDAEGGIERCAQAYRANRRPAPRPKPAKPLTVNGVPETLLCGAHTISVRIVEGRATYIDPSKGTGEEVAKV